MASSPIPSLQDAVFNIGAVARMTGISTATLHAWERRYGFPASPVRTAGGHRLYSMREIILLKQVKAQIERGLSTRQAIRLVQYGNLENRLPPETSSTTIASHSSLPEARTYSLRLLDMLCKGDLTEADRLLAELLAFASPESVTLEVIGPALSEIGRLWEEGHITIATEHLASNYLRHRLLMWMVSGPPPKPVNPIVLACAPGEWHEGSLLMLGVLLRRKGWPVAYLGQNVPFPDLAEFVEQIQPPLVVLVAMREETARALAEWPQWIRQTLGRPKVAYGGRAFVVRPKLEQWVAGYYLGDTIEQAMIRLEQFLQREQ